MLLPHVPYQYLPTGNVYPPPDPEIGRLPEQDTWTVATSPVESGRQRHLLQAAYVDGLIGDLLDELRAQGIYDDATVVLTADHGISFTPGGPIRGIEGQELTEELAADIPWVPLFVKEPGQTEGVVSEANVLSIDVLPTIADILDVELPFPVDGRSTLGPPRSTDAKPLYMSDVTPDGVSVLDPVEIPPEAHQHMLERTLASFLPDVGDPLRWWRLGPAPDLVGRPVDEVPAATPGPAGRGAARPGRLRGGADGGRAPGPGAGERRPALQPETPIAVSVNGVVAGTGRTFIEREDMAFAVMVDDRAAARGAQRDRGVRAPRYRLIWSNAEVASPVALLSANFSSHSLASVVAGRVDHATGHGRERVAVGQRRRRRRPCGPWPPR